MLQSVLLQALVLPSALQNSRSSSQCQGNKGTSRRSAKGRPVLFVWAVFPEKVCGFTPADGRWGPEHRPTTCKVLTQWLGHAVWLLVILLWAWLGRSHAHTHRYAHGGLGQAGCQDVGWVHDIFSFDTMAITAKQILELELKCISSNKHLSLFPDLSQKSFKRKRSIINWAFWRGPGTHLDNAPLSSTSAAPGKLFGLLLTAICEDDNLPKPLLVSPGTGLALTAVEFLCAANENTEIMGCGNGTLQLLKQKKQQETSFMVSNKNFGF